MSAAITFLLIWFGMVLIGLLGCILFRLNLSTTATVNILAWIQHDIIYVLIICWVLAAMVILYLYTQSTAKKEDEEKPKEEDKKEEDKKEDAPQEGVVNKEAEGPAE